MILKLFLPEWLFGLKEVQTNRVQIKEILLYFNAITIRCLGLVCAIETKTTRNTTLKRCDQYLRVSAALFCSIQQLLGALYDGLCLVKKQHLLFGVNHVRGSSDGSGSQGVTVHDQPFHLTNMQLYE